MDFEIVVCGAGPAGSTAAYKAAEQDHSVLLVDRKPRPGVPIFCAEGISRSMVKDYLEIKPEWISARVNGALIISDNYQTFVNYPDVGYILDRERFDYGLFQKAIRAGAQFMAGEITDISDDHLILNNHKRIGFKIPILADGVESILARKLGVDTVLKPVELHSCAQFLVKGIDHPEDKVSFILDRELIPGGYGWVFPKGKDRYNFGIGVAPQLAQDRPISYLERLKQRYFPQAKVLSMTGGVVPTKIIDLSHTGLFIIGDAGRLTDPLSGGGIANAIKSGFLAGIYASRILRGRASFKDYYGELKNEIIDEIKFHSQVRNIFLRLENDDFKELIKALNRIYRSTPVKDINSRKLVLNILKSSPHLLRIGFRLIRYIILGPGIFK